MTHVFKGRKEQIPYKQATYKLKSKNQSTSYKFRG